MLYAFIKCWLAVILNNYISVCWMFLNEQHYRPFTYIKYSIFLCRVGHILLVRQCNYIQIHVIAQHVPKQRPCIRSNCTQVTAGLCVMFFAIYCKVNQQRIGSDLVLALGIVAEVLRFCIPVYQSWKCRLGSMRNIWKCQEPHINAKVLSVQCLQSLWGSPAEQFALSLEEFAAIQFCSVG